MTLLKYLTACFSIPNKLPGFSFLDIRRRLLLAYLLVMSTVLGISGTALYIFFAQSLNHQVNNRLQTLVGAATPSLNTIKFKGRPSLDRDLSWRDLFSHRQQSLEWFDANGQLIAREGSNFPQMPLSAKAFSTLQNGESIFQQERQIRSVIIAVYTTQNQKNTIQLKGYIRASESTQEIETTLQQLQLGLWLGGATAIFLIGISSVYLTRQALKPTLKSFQHLKQFAADASHELGGPLTKISFASEILLSNPEQLSKPSAQKKVEIIKSGAEQMKYLLEDLLFLSRTDAVSPLIKPEKAIVFVDELLQQLAEHFREVARNQDIDFETNIQPDLVVKGDISQLNRLFSNILTNAFKYTHAGGRVILSLSLSQKDVVVSVEDTGIGIDSQYLPYIFQRFWRAKQVRKQKGLGLGLAISQTIVQQHQGKITVSSTVNVGTCFKIFLPSYRLQSK
ncbi:two-component sensor histidine kinase [Pleurocapsa sp. CCALA 161]|nr:two-component sensor histidine kinase [Pleurocapsa sp. CCALA 161]